jgi:hypothetical protein
VKYGNLRFIFVQRSFELLSRMVIRSLTWVKYNGSAQDDAATARGHQVIVDWSPYLRFRSFLKSKYLSIDNKHNILKRQF